MKDHDTQEKTPAASEGAKNFTTPSVAQNENDEYGKSLLDEETVLSPKQAQTVETDWETLLQPVVADPSLLFGPDLLTKSATAYKNPTEWTRLLHWLDSHKIDGLDKRRWKMEVKKASRNLTVVTGGVGTSTASAPSTSVGAIWLDAPVATIPLVPGWIYRPDGLAHESREGLMAVGNPAYVSEWLRDVNDGTVNLTITHRVAGRWDKLIVPASNLLKAEKVADMANQGVGIYDPKLLGRFLNEHYQLIRGSVTAIAGTKLSGVQTINSHRVAVFPAGVWQATGRHGETVRLTETAGVSFINAKPREGGDFVSAETVMGHVFQMAHPRKVRLLAGWIGAALWADQIREAFEGRFPVGNIYAIHESGKTTIIKRILSAIIGGDEVGTARDTRFRLTRQMAAATTIPLVLDEFRLNEISPSQLASLYDLLRRDYDGGVDGRGQADQTIRTYRLTAPTLVSGESRITDTALMDRIVGISLSPEEGKGWPNGTDHLRWLEEHLDENRLCAGWLLQKRLDSPMTHDQLRLNIQTLEKAIRQLPGSATWPERALWGLAVVWFGIKWFEQLGMGIGSMTRQDWEDTLSEGQQTRKSTSPVDRFVRFLEESAANGGKWRGQTVPLAVLDRTGELRIGVSAANTGFAGWSKELGMPNLGQENLEDELLRSGLAMEGELKSPLHLGPPVNATVYAYSLRIHAMAERYGIPTTYWIEVLKPSNAT